MDPLAIASTPQRGPVTGLVYAVPAALVWWLGLVLLAASRGLVATVAWSLVAGPLAAGLVVAVEAWIVAALHRRQARRQTAPWTLAMGSSDTC